MGPSTLVLFLVATIVSKVAESNRQIVRSRESVRQIFEANTADGRANRTTDQTNFRYTTARLCQMCRALNVETAWNEVMAASYSTTTTPGGPISISSASAVLASHRATAQVSSRRVVDRRIVRRSSLPRMSVVSMMGNALRRNKQERDQFYQQQQQRGGNSYHQGGEKPPTRSLAEICHLCARNKL